MSKSKSKKKEEKKVEEVEGEGEETKVKKDVIRLNTLEDYDALIKEAKSKLVIIFLSSEWNGPSIKLRKDVANLAKKYTKTVFAEIDMDNKFFFELLKGFRMNCVPSFGFIKKGRLSQSIVGADQRIFERKIRQELGLKNSQWSGLDEKWEYIAPDSDDEDEEEQVTIVSLAGVKKEEKKPKKKKEVESQKLNSGIGEKEKKEDPSSLGKNQPTRSFMPESIPAKKEESTIDQPVVIKRKMVRGNTASLADRKRSVIRVDNSVSDKEVEKTFREKSGGRNSSTSKDVEGGSGRLDLSSRKIVRKKSAEDESSKGGSGRVNLSSRKIVRKKSEENVSGSSNVIRPVRPSGRTRGTRGGSGKLDLSSRNMVRKNSVEKVSSKSKDTKKARFVIGSD